METISKGKYYYQIPATNDRFVKYQIKDNKVIECASSPFKTNTYKVRSYTHAWIDDNTLVVMAANGDASKVIWSKLNTDNMSILAEGTLDILLPESEVQEKKQRNSPHRASLPIMKKRENCSISITGRTVFQERAAKPLLLFIQQCSILSLWR